MGHGDRSHGWDQREVLNELQKDVKRLLGESRVPRPCVLLVTGDIAFSGAVRQPHEYNDAANWLGALTNAVGLESSQVFTIPGNHDVQRKIDKEDPAIGRLVRAIRAGDEQLDAILGDPRQCDLLYKRQQNYLAFAALHGSGSSPYWQHNLSAGLGLSIHLIGLNTALLAADNQDRGKLELGREQLVNSFLKSAQERSLTLVLSHHPSAGEWLRDEESFNSWLHRHADIHLSGHVHKAMTNRIETAGSRAIIKVAAGAVHNDEAEADPESHSYNFAAITLSDSGELKLAIWPRRWSRRHRDFRADVDNSDREEQCSTHLITGLKMQTEASEIWKYTGQYSPLLHALGQQWDSHKAFLDPLAQAMQKKITRKYPGLRGSVEVSVADRDDFRLAFKREYDRRYLLNQSSALSVPNPALAQLLAQPLRQVATLLQITVRSEGDISGISQLICQALGGSIASTDGKQTRIRLDRELKLGQQQSAINQVSLIHATCASNESCPQHRISVGDADALMQKYQHQADYRRELLARQINGSSLFEYACCAFAGTANDRGDQATIYQAASEPIEEQLYGIDLWLEHTLHSLQWAGFNTIDQVRGSVEQAWPKTQLIKRQQHSRRLFSPAHVVGDLIKSLLIASQDFRDSYPVLPDTLAAIENLQGKN